MGWKKEDVPSPMPAPRLDIPTRAPERIGAQRPSELASIGRSITIRGEVTGDEDLLIQGRVEGSVNLRQHSVTVGPEGVVKADIVGRVVTLEGSVEGNVSAEEQVILRSSALVQGDITAPRVVLEDGARFRGGVDMGETLERASGTGNTRGAVTKADAGRAPVFEASTDASASSAEELSAAGRAEVASGRTVPVSQ